MMVEARDENPTSEAQGETESPDYSTMGVLVVSNHCQTRDLLRHVFSDLGFREVAEASNVGEALAALRKKEVDFLVADLEGPRLEEVDLVRNALAIAPDLSILVISGHATIEWGVELMKAGVRDVLRKPLDVPVLRKKIDRLAFEAREEDEEPATEIGPFRVLEEVERGGMGIIYKALDPRSEEVVALKVLPTTPRHSMNQILRFRKEAEAISYLDHPYIVKLKTNGFSGKHYYIAMEFIEGIALDMLAYETPLHYHRLVEIMIKILEAVEYAHEKEILHRDLKPSNVLIDNRDVPHIIDFGLARYLKGDVRLTKTGVVMGTIGYIAPERIRGKPATPLSDVYSAGAILYECLTRKIPYETDSRVVTVPTRYDELVPLRELVPDIPSQLEAICFRALAISTRSRYKSAAQFRKALQHFLAGT